MIAGRRTAAQHVIIYLFVTVPMLALVAAVPLAWGWGVGWHDLGLLAAFYVVAVLGITVGLHRHFTHKSFKARPWLRVTMAIVGSLAVQGNVLNWVADHRRHHAFSDREGDPHSPWLHGTSPFAVARGFLHAHMTWFFDRDETNQHRFVPDLLADRAVRIVSKTFGVWVAVSLLLPAVLGALISWSWVGALTGFFWGGLVRLAISNHVTWSINSICHMFGSGRSVPGIARATSGPWRCCRWASRGTTCTMLIRRVPATACCRGRSTSRRPSSAGSNGWGGPTTSGGRLRAGWSGCVAPQQRDSRPVAVLAARSRPCLQG